MKKRMYLVSRDSDIEVFQSLKKSIYGVYHQFLPIDHPFRSELAHYFNVVYKMSCPPPRAIAKDWMNT